MKKTLLSKKLILILLAVASFSFAKAQEVTEVVFYNVGDVLIGNGTGAVMGDLKKVNMGAETNFALCNFEEFNRYNSYLEGWLKFDLTRALDTVPDGQTILYAEARFKVAGNAGPQGFKAYHIFNADDWEEGNGSAQLAAEVPGLTWNDAQVYDYLNPDKYAFVAENADPGGVSSNVRFNITDAVMRELGDQGNKILTLRMAPYFSEYVAGSDDKGKKWLGLYTRESPYGIDRETEPFNPGCGRIVLYVGAPQPKDFSDKGDFGNIENFMKSPDGFGYWKVSEDEGDKRLYLATRPAPVNRTPGGLAIYNKTEFQDFDLSVKAKSSYFASSTKADFITVFGYKDRENYSYVYCTGDSKGGVYQVVDGSKSLLEGQSTSAITDTAYHSYRVTRETNKLTVYIDGNEYMTYEDASIGQKGMVGLGSYNDLAFFDDFEAKDNVGVNTLAGLSEIKVFPNPSMGELTIDAKSELSSISIINLTGQVIEFRNNIQSRTAKLDLSDLKSGIYFIKCHQVNGNSTTTKFLKQ